MEEKSTSTTAINVFLSYSHADEKTRSDLERHFSILKQENQIDFWHDRKIDIGSEWRIDIEKSISSSQAFIFLISSHFLNSDFCKKELNLALLKKNDNDIVIVPIIVDYCDWKETVFGEMQVLPTNGEPISSHPNREKVLNDITNAVRKRIKEYRKTALQIAAKKEKKYNQFEISLVGDIADVNMYRIFKAIEELRKICNTQDIKVHLVRSGSIVLGLSAPEEVFHTIKDLFNKGSLFEIGGYRINKIEPSDIESMTLDEELSGLAKASKKFDKIISSHKAWIKDGSGTKAGARATFNGKTIAYIDFNKLNLSKSHFIETSFFKSSLNYDNFEGSLFSVIKFDKVMAKKSTFSLSKFIDVDFFESIFNNSKMIKCNFSSCRFISCKLIDCDLSNSSFDKTFANFSYFSNSILISTDFTGANLQHSQFSHVNAKDASFELANLSNASFRYADLTNTSFTKANLNYADLRDVNFGVDINQIAEQLSECASLYKAQMDDMVLDIILDRYPYLLDSPQEEEKDVLVPA
jgi:uncharacterized protein YjbI with pentapeptide repeats